MEKCTEIAKILPGHAEPMMAAALVLEVTKVAWLETANRESRISKPGSRMVETERAPIQRSYLKLLALEI